MLVILRFQNLDNSGGQLLQDVCQQLKHTYHPIGLRRFTNQTGKIIHAYFMMPSTTKSVTIFITILSIKILIKFVKVARKTEIDLMICV